MPYLLASVLITGVITIYDRFKAPDQVINNNFPAQPSEDIVSAAVTGSDDNNDKLMLAALAAGTIYLFNKK